MGKKCIVQVISANRNANNELTRSIVMISSDAFFFY